MIAWQRAAFLIGVSSYVLIIAVQRAKMQLRFAVAMVKHWHTVV
jgi:hypothetical protein